MNLSPGNCTYCKRSLPEKLINTPDSIKCPFCGTFIQVITFPVLYKVTEKNTEEITKQEGEASCFYHHDKKAHVVCHMCGRFICSLCDIGLDDKHICPECIGREKKNGTLTRLQNHRVLYDNISLSLAVYPVIIFFLFTFITAPIALYISIRHWKTPGSILRGSKFRFSLAIFLSLAQIGGWLFLPFAFLM